MPLGRSRARARIERVAVIVLICGKSQWNYESSHVIFLSFEPQPKTIRSISNFVQCGNNPVIAERWQEVLNYGVVNGKVATSMKFFVAIRR